MTSENLRWRAPSGKTAAGTIIRFGFYQTRWGNQACIWGRTHYSLSRDFKLEFLMSRIDARVVAGTVALISNAGHEN